MTALAGEARVLARLQSAAKAERDPIAAACLRIQQAGVWARMGQRELALTALRATRERLTTHASASLTAWLCVVEAWLAFYDGQSDLAFDKMQRAVALSTGFGLRRLQGLTSAWLGYFHYARDNVDGTLSHLKTALAVAHDDEHDALARACLVGGMALHFAERIDLAREWYAAARRHALKDGDQSVLSAITFNLAANDANQALRLQVMAPANAGKTEGAVRAGADRARHAADSVRGFNTAIGSQLCPSFVPIVCAISASVLGDFSRANDLYEHHFDAALAQGMQRMACVLWADRAWVQWHLADPAKARSCMTRAAHAAVHEGVAPAERVASCGRLAALSRLVGDPSGARVWRRRMNAAHGELLAQQQGMASELCKLKPR